MIHLKNISSASVRCVCIISVLYCAYLCIKFSLGISDFLEVISSLSHCILFLYLFVLFTRKEFFFFSFFLFYYYYYFTLQYSLPSIIWHSASLFSAICKAFSDNHFAFLHFFCGDGFRSPTPIQCYEPPSIVFRSNALNLFVTSTV